MIEGTTLVRYKNCKVRINNITYSYDINTYWEDIYKAPVQIAEVQATTEIKPLTLKKVAYYNMRQEDKILTISSRINAHDPVEVVLSLIKIGAIIFTRKELYVQKTKQKIQAEAAIPSIAHIQTKGRSYVHATIHVTYERNDMPIYPLDADLFIIK